MKSAVDTNNPAKTTEANGYFEKAGKLMKDYQSAIAAYRSGF
ncbi:hypothetical protein FACS1894187_22640 [Synergistales bacterium]|nr:hypothetical protein FACS1894187_22640 [Synergistales bacterium]